MIAAEEMPLRPMPDFVMTPEQVQEMDRIRRGQYFLVRIAGNGEVFRCKRCGAKHRYMTLMCIERPFSGLTGGLYGYWYTMGINGAEQFLKPEDRSRMEVLSKIFGRSNDLNTSHPELVRSLGIGERDLDLGAISLGVLEPIPTHEALRLQDRINSTGLTPPLLLPGLEGGR